MKKSILIVTPDDATYHGVSQALRPELYQCSRANGEEESVRALQQESASLVVVEHLPPRMGAVEFCNSLKRLAQQHALPVVAVSKRDDAADIQSALRAGVADFIVLPSNSDILEIRIKNVLLRDPAKALSATRVEVHSIVIDSERHQVTVEGRRTELTHTEFKILQLFALQPGTVFSRNQIVSCVHGSDYPVTDRSIDVQIVGLRKKLGAQGALVETVRGVGYRIRD